MKLAPFMAQLAAIVKQRIADEVAPLAREVKSLQDAVPTLTKSAVESAVAALPLPINGKDAEVDYERVGAMIKDLVDRLPRPSDGKDADPAVIKALIDEAVAAIPRAKDGAPGRDAEPIHPDTLRLQIAEEVTKAVSAIPAPEAGKAGEPGRDALQIDILATIDVTKSYPRGTWAKFEGGLLRAYRNTDPAEGDRELAGWEVVVDGLKGIQIEQNGERGFRVVAERTSGQKSALECVMPVLLDRGRYSDSKDYEIGDVVDWSGSMWKAETETKGVEPRPDVPQWRLLVRRGRDGKDAIVRTVEPQRVKV